MYRFLTLVKKWQFPLQALVVIILAMNLGKMGGLAVRSLLVSNESGAVPMAEVKKGKSKSDKATPLHYFDPVTGRNLFDVDVSRPKAPKAPKIDPATIDESNIQKTRAGVSLVGTLAGPNEVALAVILNRSNRMVDTFGVGDDVFGQAKILKIERMRVILDRGGKTEVLEIDENEGGGGKPKAHKPARSSAPAKKDEPKGDDELDIREVDENTFEIDREGFEETISDLTPLLTQARVVPHFDDGKLSGYKIFSIKSGSLYEEIGLRNGDVIKTVNGNMIDDPTKAMQLFTQLRSEEEFNIEIVRGGSPLTFNYTLR